MSWAKVIKSQCIETSETNKKEFGVEASHEEYKELSWSEGHNMETEKMESLQDTFMISTSVYIRSSPRGH